MKLFMKIGTKCIYKFYKIFFSLRNKCRHGTIAKLRLQWENVMYLEYMLMGYCIVLVFTELFTHIIV